MNTYLKVYRTLYKHYGAQGWWPLFDRETGRCTYHQGSIDSDEKKFEIALGAILTQNIAWKNVEKALAVLSAKGKLSVEGIRGLSGPVLGRYIRSTGYYNQKAIKIKAFLEWYRSRNYTFRSASGSKITDIRDDLLRVKGIGPETADSILLYALNLPVFVIDAYTRRIFARLSLLTGDETYAQIQGIFQANCKPDPDLYKEYHALIVCHGKSTCMKNPACAECCIGNICPFKRYM